MLRSFSIGLLASAVAIAPLPLKAQDGSAEDLGDVMSISLKDVVKPTLGFQGALQGAGTPNQAGIGGFLPLSVGDNSVWFLDALANVNFADYENNSSIINTDVAGTTVSTSTRVGYRWLNGDRSWMYGLNAGYDTRPMATGAADSGVSLFGTEKTVFFQQAAVNLEAVSNTWNFNAYGLLPTGKKVQQINWLYQAGALATYGLDAGYNITPDLTASIGYYYQDGDGSEADGSGVLGRVAYEITYGLIAGVNVTYDEAFETRFSADVEYRFGGPSKTVDKKVIAELPVIQALSSSPNHRNVRVHDKFTFDYPNDFYFDKDTGIAAAKTCLKKQNVDPDFQVSDLGYPTPPKKALISYVSDDGSVGVIDSILKFQQDFTDQYPNFNLKKWESCVKSETRQANINKVYRALKAQKIYSQKDIDAIIQSMQKDANSNVKAED